MEWRPIETAPRDGTVILLYDNVPVVGQWVRHRAYAHCWAWMMKPLPKADLLIALEPTHWMPLPTAPEPSPIKPARMPRY